MQNGTQINSSKGMLRPEKRIKIAEACGIKAERYFGKAVWPYGGKMHYSPPDYFNDLNAMHEAEKVIIIKEGNDPVFDFPWPFRYAVEMSKLELVGEIAKLHATAAQRAEAFGKTLNLW